MATWVRLGTGTAPTAFDADLIGDYALDNATAPADFDPAAVTSVQTQWTITGSGFVDDSWDNVAGVAVETGATEISQHPAEGSLTNRNVARSSDHTDSTGIPTGLSVADWEAALVRGDGTLDAWCLWNKVKGTDGSTLTVSALTVTITYTPASASFTGTLAVTQDAQTSVASGTVVPPAFSGTSAATQEAQTSAASGTVVAPGGGSSPTHSSVTTNAATSTATFSHAVDAGTGADRLLLVAVRHGQATDDITHSVPTYNGVNMTQVGTVVNAQVTSPTRRRITLWKMVDPPSGSNTLAGGFSATVAWYSVTAVVVAAAGDVGTVSQLSSQNGATISIDLTAGNADSLAYLFAMTSAGSDDPFTPGTITEVEDSTDTSVANHSFTTGWVDATGSSQSLTTSPAATADWGAYAIEVTPVSGGNVTGTSTVVQADQTSTASGTVEPPPISGTSTAVQDPQVSTASGTHNAPGVDGTSAATQDDQTSSASGSVVPPAFTGTSAAIQDAQTATGAGSSVPPAFSGTSAPTQESQVSAASGTVAEPSFTGTLDVTQQDQFSTASGTVVNEGITGSLAVIQEHQVATASGTFTPPAVTGTASSTQDDQTANASGTVIPPAFTGTSASVQDDQTSTASGSVTTAGIAGSLAVTQDDQTSTATGTHTPAYTGTLAVTQGDQVSAASGTFLGAITGTLAVTQEDQVLSAVGDAVGLTFWAVAPVGYTTAPVAHASAGVAHTPLDPNDPPPW